MALRQAAFGDAVRRARKQKRWKQKDLAAAVHVEPVTVSRWERGVTRPDFDMIEEIASALEKKITYFVGETTDVDLDREQGEAIAARLEAAVDRLEELLGDQPEAQDGQQPL